MIDLIKTKKDIVLFDTVFDKKETDRLILTDKGYNTLDAVKDDEEVIIWADHKWKKGRFSKLDTPRKLIKIDFQNKYSFIAGEGHIVEFNTGISCKISDIQINDHIRGFFQYPIIGDDNSLDIHKYGNMIDFIWKSSICLRGTITGDDVLDCIPGTDYSVKSRIDFIGGLIDINGKDDVTWISLYFNDKVYFIYVMMLLNQLGIDVTSTVYQPIGNVIMYRIFLSPHDIKKLILLGMNSELVNASPLSKTCEHIYDLDHTNPWFVKNITIIPDMQEYIFIDEFGEEVDLFQICISSIY